MCSLLADGLCVHQVTAKERTIIDKLKGR